MGLLIRFLLLVAPETILLAGTLWLVVWLNWLQPLTVVLIFAGWLMTLALIYRPFKGALQPAPPTGGKAFVGAESVLIHAAAPVGLVRLNGELWSARLAGNEYLCAGAPVRVVDAEGLALIVEPLAGRDAQRPPVWQ